MDYIEPIVSILSTVIAFTVTVVISLKKFKKKFTELDKYFNEAIQLCFYYETFELSGQEKKEKVLEELKSKYVLSVDELKAISEYIDYFVSGTKKINYR